MLHSVSKGCELSASHCCCHQSLTLQAPMPWNYTPKNLFFYKDLGHDASSHNSKTKDYQSWYKKVVCCYEEHDHVDFLVCLVLFVGMWKTMEFWTRKQFSAVISTHKAIPAAAWMVVLKAKQTGDMA